MRAKMNRAEKRRQKKLAEKTARNAKPGQGANRTPKQQTPTLQQSLELAVRHHNAGDLAKAEGLYQQVLQAEPRHPAALHLLGVIAHQVGKNDVAVDLITQALAIQPDDAEAHNNLGLALQDLGKLDEAVASYQKAFAIKPNYAEAHYNLGLALQNAGKLDEAAASYHKALDIKPDFAEAHSNLGNVLQDLGAPDEAVASYQKALAIKPDYADAHNNLGNAFRELRKLDEALASYHKALAIKPDFADAHNNLGNVLQELGKLDEAINSLRKAIAIKPDYAEAHNNLGLVLMEDGRLDEAIVHYQKAIDIKPDYADVHNNLGYLLQEIGRLEEAEQNFRRALELKPDTPLTLVNLGNVLKDIAYNNERTDRQEISGVTGTKKRVDPIINGRLWEEAHTCADKGLSLVPNNTSALALKTAALLAFNEQDNWAALVDCDRLIQIQIMSEPEGYADLRTFNESLLQRCANDPNQSSESFGKSIRMGQRINHLQYDPWPGPVNLLLEFANKEAKRYCAEHPMDPQHPFLAQYPSHWKFIAWGSILGKQGYHESHIHGDGWLSGVYYGKLPDVMDSENKKREGWIKFGRPNNYVDNVSSPEFHLLRPQEGMMILFPSYFYHQTVPIESDDTRFTVAFDLIPLSR